MINALYFGITGMLLLLISFVTEVLRLLHRAHFVYLLLNFLGSAAMTYYAFVINSWPFLILNGVWALFSLYGLIRLYFPKKEDKNKTVKRKTKK
jgi:hypothetical protein